LTGTFQGLLEELFAPVGGVSFRRMFGGAGVFIDGLMFALVLDDVLYLKGDDRTRPQFEAEGCEPFRYEARGRTVTTSYWRLPERLFDESEGFAEWADNAFDVAKRSQAKKGAAARGGRRAARGR
jgi:DNA transformation protein and related proteins